jgi:hypothetical protein
MLAKLEENRLNDVALPYGRRYKEIADFEAGLRDRSRPQQTASLSKSQPFESVIGGDLETKLQREYFLAVGLGRAPPVCVCGAPITQRPGQ